MPVWRPCHGVYPRGWGNGGRECCGCGDPAAVPALFLAVENVPSRVSLLGARAPRVTPPVRRALRVTVYTDIDEASAAAERLAESRE